MQGFNWRWTAVAAVSLGGVVISAYMLKVVMAAPAPYDAELVEAGQVVNTVKSVRRKGDSAHLWNDLESSQKVFWGDAVSTGDQSSAELHLGDGVQVHLSPSSLVVMSRDEGRISVRLLKGQVQFKSAPRAQGAKPLTIEVNGTVVQSSAEISAQMDSKKEVVELVAIDEHQKAETIVIDTLGRKTTAPLADKAIEDQEMVRQPAQVAAAEQRAPVAETPNAEHSNSEEQTSQLQTGQMQTAQQQTTQPLLAQDTEGTPSTSLPQNQAKNSTVTSEEAFGLLRFDVGFSFFRIDATDPQTNAQAIILSNMNPKLSLDWIQHWSARWQSFLNFHALEAAIQDPAPRKISPATERIFGFGLGLKHQWNQRFSLLYQLDYSQLLFVRKIDATTLTLGRVGTPQASSQMQYTVLNQNQFTAGVAAQIAIQFPGQGQGFSSHVGKAYAVTIFLDQQVRSIKASVRGQVFYGQRYQDSSLVRQIQTDLGSTLGLTWGGGQ